MGLIRGIGMRCSLKKIKRNKVLQMELVLIVLLERKRAIKAWHHPELPDEIGRALTTIHPGETSSVQDASLDISHRYRLFMFSQRSVFDGYPTKIEYLGSQPSPFNRSTSVSKRNIDCTTTRILRRGIAIRTLLREQAVRTNAPSPEVHSQYMTPNRTLPLIGGALQLKTSFQMHHATAFDLLSSMSLYNFQHSMFYRMLS